MVDRPDGERSLHGWSPRIPEDISLTAVLELAFDYRGDVTLVLADGSELVGYVFNRDEAGPEPTAQLFVPGEDHARTVPYGAVRGVRFSGRDMAAGNSYAAWLDRRQAARHHSSPGVPGDS